MAIKPIYGVKTVLDMEHSLRAGAINLAPGFQRQSIWTPADRRRLIESVIAGYPLPNIFLYRRNHKGKTVYDVIDGKQRLESIFMFRGAKGFAHQQFDVRLDIGEGGLNWWTWADIKSHEPDVRFAVDNFPLQVAEVTGDLSEIVELFVRINSTGKSLTSGEKRHARFYESRFLKEANRLVGRHAPYFLREKILSQGEVARMKGTELCAELLMSIQKGGIINKKTALDRAIGNDEINARSLERLSREFTQTTNLLRKMFPNIGQTRFRNIAEYYSLFLLVWEMRKSNFVLTDRKRNAAAFEMLKRLSKGVDELLVQFRQARPVRPRPPFSDYLLTVRADTDSSANRERRERVLKGMLRSLYARKDDQRIFSPEQRRILWNSDAQPKCANPKCKRKLHWSNFTVDHILPHSKGGRTRLGNAQLMCLKCNIRKGAKKAR